MRQVILCLLAAVFLASCSKDEIIHENLVIDDNQAPDITGVSIVTVNNYVNSLYIDLYGRTPTTNELEADAAFLIDEAYSVDARTTLVSDMMQEWEYYKNINLLTTQKFLVDVDSFSMVYQMEYWAYLVDIFNDMGATIEAAYYQYEYDRLEKLIGVHVELAESAITVNEYYRRYLDNYYYDQVNMGSLNFVVAAFNNLFHRYPTDDEQASGVAMVDGAPEQLFLMDGSSKGDFMDIMTTTPEFYQGLVIEFFTTFLARMPDSEEMDTWTQALAADGDVESLKIDLLTSEEYAGF